MLHSFPAWPVGFVPDFEFSATGEAGCLPYPCEAGGMAMAKRPIDRDCHTRGLKDKPLP
jgi:hypothetical protein